MAYHSRLLTLPNEVKDLILDQLFAPTPYDYPGSHKAELRVYTGHVILRRIYPIPPPRFKGCRALMKTCKTMCHIVLAYVYSRLEFDVVIFGSSNDPGPLYNRLTSEYPIGSLSTSLPIRHLRNIRLILHAWGEEDVNRLETRLSQFLDVIKDNYRLKIGFIGFYTNTGVSSYGSADNLAKMLEQLRSKTPTQAYGPNDSVSEESMHSLLVAINNSRPVAYA